MRYREAMTHEERMAWFDQTIKGCDWAIRIGVVCLVLSFLVLVLVVVSLAALL